MSDDNFPLPCSFGTKVGGTGETCLKQGGVLHHSLTTKENHVLE